MPPSVRVLFLSDTHLGIDLPGRPRVERRRRGDDFFACFERAIEPALSGEADILVHGGDLFYRSKVPAWLAARVYGRLADLADAGVDLFLVLGNHERSAVPRSLLLTHPRVHVFDAPRTFVVQRGGLAVALSGFPHSPVIRSGFGGLLLATRFSETPADIRLLCIHQLVEGASVGPSGYTFREGADVLRGADVPGEFAAVLSGHVHRAQVLERDLAGRRLAAPVLYCGSIERTSFAEKDEEKGLFVLDFVPGGRGGVLHRREFRLLPARPMADIALRAEGANAEELGSRLEVALSALDPDSVVRVRLDGEPSPGALAALGAGALRSAAPPTMNVSFAWRGRDRYIASGPRRTSS